MGSTLLPKPDANDFVARSAAAHSLISAALVVVELAIATVLGIGLAVLGADGGAWILGGIAAGAIVFRLHYTHSSSPVAPNRTARRMGQLLIGLTVGFSIQHSDLAALSSQIPLFAALILLSLGIGGGIGLLYARVEPTDALTAILATVPGNIGVMASIAADYGKNAPLVSLVQLMRFTVVTFLIPLMVSGLTHFSQPHDLPSTLHQLTPHWAAVVPMDFVRLGLLFGMTTAAIYGGGKLRVPVAAFLCPILVGMVFNGLLAGVPLAGVANIATADFRLPPLFNLVGQILLGITIGEYWGMNPNLSRATVARATVPVMITFVAGLLSAAIARLVTSWDWLTCLLVTAPGGSPEMIWIALSLNHDVEIVTAGHLLRLVAINALLPAMIVIGQYFEQRGFNGSLPAEALLGETATPNMSPSRVPSNTP